MPSLEVVIDSLMQEQNKLINMGKIKGPKVHDFNVKYGSGNQYQIYKDKDKRKAHANPKKEGHSKPFNDALWIQRWKGKNRGEMHLPP